MPLALSAALLFLCTLTGARATPIPPDGGGGSGVNPAESPGAPFSWEGSVGDVKTGNGDKMTAVPLVAWTARGGLPVSFAVTHNSEATYQNFNGMKWTYSYLEFVVEDTAAHTVTAYWDDGSVYSFTLSGSTYTPPAGIHSTLVKNGAGDFTLTTTDQIAYRFNHDVSSLANYSFLTSITDENGNAVTVTYLSSSSYAVYQIIDPTSRKITLTYNSYGQLWKVQDPLSRVWVLGYDATTSAANLTTITFPAVNGASPYLQFTYGTHVYMGVHYDANDIVGLRDLRGNSSAYTYTTDGAGSIASETDPAGNATDFAYGTTTPTPTITDPNGQQTIHTYDSSGRLTSVKDTYGFQDVYAYDSDNNVLTHKDKNLNTWTYTYDTGNPDPSAHGNRLSSLDPRNAAASLPAVQYAYTAHNRLYTVTRPSSTKATLGYDGHDNLTSVVESYLSGGTSHTAATTTIAYPPTNYGLPASKTDTNGHKTQYTFDTDGNLSAVVTPWARPRAGPPTTNSASRSSAPTRWAAARPTRPTPGSGWWTSSTPTTAIPPTPTTPTPTSRSSTTPISTSPAPTTPTTACSRKATAARSR